MRLISPILLAVVVLSGDRRCAADLPSSALRVSATVTPTRASRTQPPESILVAVRVRNPRPWPVDVHIGGPPYSVRWDIDSTIGRNRGMRLSHLTRAAS
jgi:hypothetical protein